MKFSDLSPMQQKVLRLISQKGYYGDYQLAGYRMAPYLSAANALIRKGLAFSIWTGQFGATKEGLKLLEEK